MKVKALVSLLALAGAFNAAHAGVNTSQGNAEIFLAVYDDAETKSFLYDTGVNASQLIAGPATPLTFNVGADANWASFVSSVGGIQNLNWMVGAVQNKTGKDTKWVYETLGNGAAVGTAGSNTAFNGSLNSEITLLNSSSALPGTSEVAAAGTATYFGSDHNGFTPVGVASTFNKLNVGNVKFFGAANSNTSSGTAAIDLLDASKSVASLNTDSGSAVLTLAAAPTAAVPEPSSYVLALTALAGFGILRRRAK